MAALGGPGAYANPTVSKSPIAFGNHHVGDVITQQGVSITNTVISNASFQEGLDASAGSATDQAFLDSVARMMAKTADNDNEVPQTARADQA